MFAMYNNAHVFLCCMFYLCVCSAFWAVWEWVEDIIVILNDHDGKWGRINQDVVLTTKNISIKALL